MPLFAVHPGQAELGRREMYECSSMMFGKIHVVAIRKRAQSAVDDKVVRIIAINLLSFLTG